MSNGSIASRAPSKANRGARTHGQTHAQSEGERLDPKFLAGEFEGRCLLTGAGER